MGEALEGNDHHVRRESGTSCDDSLSTRLGPDRYVRKNGALPVLISIVLCDAECFGADMPLRFAVVGLFLVSQTVALYSERSRSSIRRDRGDAIVPRMGR